MRSQIVSKALAWVGQSFRPGVSAQCAAWISYLLSALGFGPALYPPHQWRQEQGYIWAPWQPTDWVPDYSGADNKKPMGERITFSALQPGDLVIFGYTYTAATSTHIGIYVGDGWMIHRPTSDRPVERAWVRDGYWREKFETGLRLLPPDRAESGNTTVDPPGAPGSTPRIHRARVEAHSGRAGCRVDGQLKPLTRLDLHYALLGNGRSSVEIGANWDADGNQDLKFFQHDQDGQMRQHLLIDGKVVDLVEVELEQRCVPGKPPGFRLDVAFL